MSKVTRSHSPHLTPTVNTGTSSSNSSSSSPRATAPRTRSPTVFSTATTNDEDNQAPWMETATPGKFCDFQTKIYPVVEFLTSKPIHASHAFTKRWHALKRTPNIPMTADITWRNIKILLGIADMFEYRDFLLQCPEFSTIVTIKPSKTTRSGFEFGISEQFKRYNTMSPAKNQQQSVQSHIGDD
jgi:hypothetical protein